MLSSQIVLVASSSSGRNFTFSQNTDHFSRLCMPNIQHNAAENSKRFSR